jgi:hypothetical protein
MDPWNVIKMYVCTSYIGHHCEYKRVQFEFGIWKQITSCIQVLIRMIKIILIISINFGMCSVKIITHGVDNMH